MPDHPNRIVARRLWDAIALGDAQTLAALLEDKCAWRMPGSSPLAGTYEGAAAISEFMADVGERADDLHSDLIEIFASEEGAVLRYSIHAVRGNERLDTEHLFRIRIENGLITEGIFAPVDQAAYDRFFTPRPTSLQ